LERRVLEIEIVEVDDHLRGVVQVGKAHLRAACVNELADDRRRKLVDSVHIAIEVEIQRSVAFLDRESLDCLETALREASQGALKFVLTGSRWGGTGELPIRRHALRDILFAFPVKRVLHEADIGVKAPTLELIGAVRHYVLRQHPRVAVFLDGLTRHWEEGRKAGEDRKVRCRRTEAHFQREFVECACADRLPPETIAQFVQFREIVRVEILRTNNTTRGAVAPGEILPLNLDGLLVVLVSRDDVEEIAVLGARLG
jgi:hypothetical protein